MMSKLRIILDELAKVLGSLLTIAATLSLMLSIASYFASRSPLAAEVDVIPLGGIRLATRLGLNFQERLVSVANSLDSKTRESLVSDWARVGAALQSDTSVLLIRVFNRGSKPVSNLGITIDFVGEFHDIAVDTNARAILDALSSGPMATYERSRQRLLVQTFPKLPAKTQLTLSVWGKYDLPPELSVTIVADEFGAFQPERAKRISGLRASILENVHWVTIALGLLVIYYVLAGIERRVTTPSAKDG